MNNYPIWWDMPLTVYNKYIDPDTKLVQWYRHNLTNCFWKYMFDRVTIGTTTAETNYTICRIPKSVNFVERYKYTPQSNAFTLGVGDIIVLGDIYEDIDEYTPGNRSSDLIKKYKNLQGCIIIDTVSVNTGTGRACEHYLVKGA